MLKNSKEITDKCDEKTENQKRMCFWLREVKPEVWRSMPLIQDSEKMKPKFPLG